MNYLAIDASTEACSVALTYQGNVFHRFELCPQSHSIVLLPMVDEVLKEANCQLAELDGLIYGQGPGSFTGVRIGIGVAQGLAFAANLPVVGVSTLQAMAQQAYRKTGAIEVIAAIDARMSEIYTNGFSLNENKLMVANQADAVLSPEKASEHYQGFNQQFYGVGTGWDAYQANISIEKSNQGTPDILYPDALDMLTIAMEKFAQGEAVSAEQAQPVYVRDTVSWKKLPGR
ncbi:tRNA (adenosine(37)-N6)-threonylcarbamoyltransferase complex dimerization subunit type 1 TsaB [Thalassotalea sp. PLHSN55]|uniref:tRNA (adenosine(37)-N6)-threonylcarbamoyltransferase complex dimerization subunit type 1 TsaB n=1 Tax=Thalassotalea sp. PLHSN55 TaxID=3435888 RepID=UPI003F84B7AC